MTRSSKMAAPAAGRGAARWSPERLRRRAKQVAVFAVLITFFVIFLYPFLVIWSSGLKDSSTETHFDPFAPPTVVHLDNVIEAWTIGKFDRYVGNTVLYCLVIVSVVTFFGCLTGYALAMVNLPGAKVLLGIFLLGLMVPFQSVMIPMYYLARDVKILGTYWGMIVPSTALSLPFAIYLMRAFFSSLPRELADAARIDGCTEFGVFWRVMLPLAYPGMASLATFMFLFTWSAFDIPLIFVLRDELRPVALGMMFYTNRFGADRGMMAAGATIITVPIVVIYLIFQRHIVRGITAGAVKG